MIEVEYKYKVFPTSQAKLTESLASFPVTRRVHNVDIYYDTSTFHLLQQAVFVRVRNSEHLEFKFNEQATPDHLHCQEFSFPLTLSVDQVHEMNSLFARFLPEWQAAQSIEEAIVLNHLIPLAHIDNKRTQYQEKDLTICVDHVEGLGDFVEIEAQCSDESEIDRARTTIHNFSAQLPAAQQIRVGYVELWLQKHHPQAYQMGKYHV